MDAHDHDAIRLGRYELLAELGPGGMTDAYLAKVSGPAGFFHILALKHLRRHLVEEPDFLDMFLDEVRLAARFNHPNIVHLFEVGEDSGRYFIAMEYVDGRPFDRVRRRARKNEEEDLAPRLTLGHQLRVLCDMLAGLHYAHELTDSDGRPLGLVHRDVSPHHVFVTYEGQVKVVDFGVARADPRSGARSRTATGVLYPKLQYTAPEQARGDAVDRRADVFSAGMMLWEVLTGDSMWRGLSSLDIFQRLHTGPIPAPSSVRGDIPPELERICLRALALRAGDRYPTAASMREDLERAIEPLGLRVSTGEVGAAVSEMFREGRAQDKAILAGLTGPARSVPAGDHPDASLRSLSTSTIASLSSWTSPASLPSGPDDDPSWSGSPYRDAPPRPAPPTAPSPAPSSPRRLPVVLLASLGALLLAVVAAATR